MNTNIKHIGLAALLAAAFMTVQQAQAQSVPPSTELEKESLYVAAVESRTDDIINDLKLDKDSDKAQTVHKLIVDQYRVMRARDVLIDAQLRAQGMEANYPNRAEKLKAESKVIHDSFFNKLSAVLTPDQIELVKDKMTYNKVKVTFDAYCQIVEKLTDEQKAKILELLKAAREEAVDGGNAAEKSAIFQKYKDQINVWLTAQGHDVEKALKEWAEKHPSTNSPASK